MKRECQRCFCTECECPEGPDLLLETLAPELEIECARELIFGAFHFDLEPTGNARVDMILGAICRAGKMYPHTKDWSERTPDQPSAIEVIQAAANDAARELDTSDNEQTSVTRSVVQKKEGPEVATKGPSKS